jgi:hypothetical protein
LETLTGELQEWYNVSTWLWDKIHII